MIQICPTVTAFDLATYTSQLDLVSAFAKRIHIDVMDGIFTPTTSPLLQDIYVPKFVECDLHVMYQNPHDYIHEIVALQPATVIVHAESNTDIALFAQKMRMHGIKTGIALLPETSVASIEHILPHIQHVLIFAGKLGYHGGDADLTQLNKVDHVHAKHKIIELGWDGGVTADNILKIAQAGIEIINVGSCIHSAPNPENRYNELLKIANNKE